MQQQDESAFKKMNMTYKLEGEREREREREGSMNIKTEKTPFSNVSTSKHKKVSNLLMNACSAIFF